MNIDKAAQQRIAELEADLVAEGKRIDLLLEQLYERDTRIRSLEYDLAMLRRDRRHEVA